MDWSSAIFSLSFIIPIILNVEGSLHWQVGAMAGLQSWIGLLMYLQRCCSRLIFWGGGFRLLGAAKQGILLPQV